MIEKMHKITRKTKKKNKNYEPKNRKWNKEIKDREKEKCERHKG